MKRLLTVNEVSAALGLKPATIRVWINRRKLPRVNCGRAVRIPAEAVERFISANTIPAREPCNARQ
jgi:excisionase family DNA binding protein